MTDQQRAAQAAAERIRVLNDEFRKGRGKGSLLVTSGIISMGREFQERVIDLVRRFDAFTPDNDPHGEHDFGELVIDGERVFFKIDYYNATFDAHSADPADVHVTHRVLTIMLASEY
jgi:hypothetical protein